jgi:archaemetzincin
VIPKIYFAFLNNYYPPDWQNLSGDLSKHLPYIFSDLKIHLDLQSFYYDERNQYYSTQILSSILTHMPSDGKKIVGITNVDLFVPILTFLFGEAQLGGNGAIVSTYRLRNEFYGLPRDNDLFYNRILKEILHELGHTIGLIHCKDYECVMNFSTYVENIDLKKIRYCKQCENKIANLKI